MSVWGDISYTNFIIKIKYPEVIDLACGITLMSLCHF